MLVRRNRAAVKKYAGKVGDIPHKKGRRITLRWDEIPSFDLSSRLDRFIPRPVPIQMDDFGVGIARRIGRKKW